MAKWNQWAAANSTLLASIGWFIGGDVACSIGLGDNYSTSNFFTVGAGGIGFAIGGMMTAYALRLTEASMGWKHVSWITIGWIIGLAIGWTCGFAIGKEVGIRLFDQTKFLFIPIRSHAAAFAIASTIGRTIGLGISFMIGGGVIGYTLRRLNSLAIQQKQIAWLAIGWSIALALGMVISKFIILPTLGWIVDIIMANQFGIGLAVGLVVFGIAVRMIWHGFSWARAVLVVIKWSMGISVGLLIGTMTIAATQFIGVMLSAPSNDIGQMGSVNTGLALLYFYPTAAMQGLFAIPEALGFAIAGAIGFSITLRCVRRGWTAH